MVGSAHSRIFFMVDRMRTLRLGRLVPVALVLAAPLHVARAQRMTGPHPSPKIPMPVQLDTHGQVESTLARVGDDVYIAGQPTAAALRSLHERGVTTVVNLRPPDEMAHVPYDEPAAAKALGMTYISLPVRGNERYPFTPETLRRFAEVMRTAKGGVLLHCTVAWRASHLWAAYLIQERGLPDDSALVNARAINLMDGMGHGGGMEPVEQFLGRKVTGLRHGQN